MDRRRILLVALLVLGGLFAYRVASRREPEDGPPKPRPRVPAHGTVRVDGSPLSGAVVSFIPMDSGGTATNAETGEDGSYDLIYQGFPGGTAPGRYKVYISYLVAPDGRTVGLDLRGGMVPDPLVFVSKERLPAKYSEMGKSELIVDVPAGGRTIDFDLKGPLLPPAEAESEIASPEPAVPATGPGAQWPGRPPPPPPVPAPGATTKRSPG